LVTEHFGKLSIPPVEANADNQQQMVDTNDFTPTFKDCYNSYEDLRFMVEVYQWLFVINHNPQSIRGKGSNIYFHIRRSNGTGTGGCTAVKEKDILKIIEWLSDSTLILQLPKNVY
jgi:L,D-peptidoglycan transpeptidase YkuD (ErfK/YbiS/YcfS/YnhG family)